MADNTSCAMNQERECVCLAKVQELERELHDIKSRNEKTHSNFYDRLAVLERYDAVQTEQYKNIMEKLGNLTDTLTEMKNDSKEMMDKMAPLTHRVKDLEDKYESISADVKAIKEKPGKRWDTLVEKIMWAVAAAVITIVLSKIGLL